MIQFNNPNTHAQLSILYSEPDPSTYAGVELKMRGKTEVFNSGTPTVDFITAECVGYFRLESDADFNGFDGSSSIDHFVLNGGVLDEDPTDLQVQDARAKVTAYLIGTGEIDADLVELVLDTESPA